jgi:RNA polymerase sigma-70 factor (ECF subfamily)
MREMVLVQAERLPEGVASEEDAKSLERGELDQLLAANAPLAYRVAMGVLRNHSEAEDVTQEALFRAFRKSHLLRDGQRFKGWLVRMTFRLALDRRRSSHRRADRETRWAQPELRPPTPSVEEMVAAKQFQERLGRALDELPRHLRLVLILAAMEGYSMAEVAEILRTSTGTVKSRLFKARKCLAEKLR